MVLARTGAHTWTAARSYDGPKRLCATHSSSRSTAGMPSGIQDVGMYFGGGQMIDAPRAGETIRAVDDAFANSYDSVGMSAPSAPNGHPHPTGPPRNEGATDGSIA